MKRKTNHTERLRRLIAKRGRWCEFCGEPVIQIASIPQNRRIRVTTCWVEFYEMRGNQRNRRSVRIATLEHVQRLADGGTYDPKNLKVACVSCNADRARQAHVRSMRQQNRAEQYQKTGQWPPNDCRHCGKTFGSANVKRYKRSESCVACHARQSRWYVSAEYTDRIIGHHNIMQIREDQKTIGMLLDDLSGFDPRLPVSFDFARFRPYGLFIHKGFHSDVAIGYNNRGLGWDVLALTWHLKDAIGKRTKSLKKNRTRINKDTAVWVSNEHESCNTIIVCVVQQGEWVVLKTELVTIDF